MDYTKLEEINGKMYHFDRGYDASGPSYTEMELGPATKHYGSGWQVLRNGYALCGKCRGEFFRVSSCNDNYEAWAYCPCGNKFLLHSG